jgi:hypothetical protein
MLVWIRLVWLGTRAGPCEHSNESLGSEEIVLPAERLLASQQGLCLVGLFRTLELDTTPCVVVRALLCCSSCHCVDQLQERDARLWQPRKSNEKYAPSSLVSCPCCV